MKTILSIDGGGMKGYIPCYVLAELEKRSGKTCFEMFDLFSGTSIGGILACLLASGKTASEALDFFTVDGPKIFGSERLFGHDGVFEARYGGDKIEACLQARMGTLNLSDLKKALLVPAFDLVSYDPYFFKSPVADQDFALWQVGRATSAAQTYFPAFQLSGKMLWDGGNVANNPAACVVAEATRDWPGEELTVLSVGCGQAQSKFTAGKLIDGGLLHTGLETLSLLFDANDELPDYILKRLMVSGKYYRISPRLDKSLDIDGASVEAINDLDDAAKKCVTAFSDTLDDFIRGTGSTSKAPALQADP